MGTAENINKSIFIIEDSMEIQVLLKELFVGEDYDVYCASNGQEALDLLRTLAKLPAVIFLDLMMPIMDGYTFREEQQKDQRLSPIPVVVMTADGRIEFKTMKLGADGYIKKPVNVETLLETAKRYTS